MTPLSTINRLIAAGSQPLFVFNRLALNGPRVFVLFTVPYGFNYLLRRIVSRWPSRGAAAIDPDLNVEAFSVGSGVARQNVPIPFGLFSSPAGDDAVSVVEPGAPLGVSGTAAERMSTKIINLAFCYGDTIRLEITGQTGLGAPPWVDVVMEGYLASERALAMWSRQRGAGRA